MFRAVPCSVMFPVWLSVPEVMFIPLVGKVSVLSGWMFAFPLFFMVSLSSVRSVAMLAMADVSRSLLSMMISPFLSNNFHY